MDHSLLRLTSRPDTRDLGDRERVPRRAVEVGRGERFDQCVRAFPEPRRPIGVGVGCWRRFRWCGIEHGPPGPTVHDAQMSGEVGEIPPRAGRYRGVERTSLERHREAVDVGPDVVEVRLGDHEERR